MKKGRVQGKNFDDTGTSLVFEYIIDLWIGPLLIEKNSYMNLSEPKFTEK